MSDVARPELSGMYDSDGSKTKAPIAELTNEQWEPLVRDELRSQFNSGQYPRAPDASAS